jgi:hypothetical protein
MMRASLFHAVRFVSSGIALLTLCSPAAAQSISYESSLRYSQGKYTTDGTVTSSFWLNEFTYSTARWWAEVMVPLIYQDSADVRYVGGMPMPVRERGGGGGITTGEAAEAPAAGRASPDHPLISKNSASQIPTSPLEPSSTKTLPSGARWGSSPR